MAGLRKDTRGIVAPGELMARVRFRRLAVARPLRPYLENYWFIDWDLDEPYESRVVPHPSVNMVFQSHPGREPFCEVAGVGLDLFTIKLEGVGRVCGAKFRPGAFRAFHVKHAADLTDRHIPLAEVFPGSEGAVADILGPAGERERADAFDAFLGRLAPTTPDPLVAKAAALVRRVQDDRTLLRVDDLAAEAGLSVRGLQRLFAEYVGVSPKWVIIRFRIHEAVEHAGAGADWARLAADLGYSDQAHLVRDFTATLGMSPSVYAKAIRTPG